jgi:hypothetical protein
MIPYAALQYGTMPSPIAGAMQGTESNISASLSMDDGDVNKSSAAQQFFPSQGSFIPHLQFGTELGAFRDWPRISDARAVGTHPHLDLAIQQHQAFLPSATLNSSPLPGGGTHQHELVMFPHITADTKGRVSNTPETKAITTSERSTISLDHSQGRLHPNVHPSPVLQHMRPSPSKEAKTSSRTDGMSTAPSRITLRPLQYPQARLSTDLPKPRQSPASIHSGRVTDSTQAPEASSFAESSSITSERCSVSSAPPLVGIPPDSFHNHRAYSVVRGASATSDRETGAAACSEEEQKQQQLQQQQQQRDIAASDLEGIMKEPIQEWGETTDISSPHDVKTRSYSSSSG